MVLSFKQMNVSRMLVWFLIFSAACIDPLSVDLTSSPRRLVVDGMITDQEGAYEVKLFYSNDINTSKLIPFELASGAIIYIKDDLGNSFQLIESEPGIYKSEVGQLTGQVGRSYSLNILLNEKEYVSAPQLMKPTGEIEEIRFEFEAESLAGYSGTMDDAFNVKVDAKGIVGADNLYRWRWITVFKAQTYPELRVRRTPGGDIPDPEPCSGYIYTGGQLVQVGECTCCYCWSYGYSPGAFVSQNNVVNGVEFNDMGLGKIPITPMHYYDRYHISVQQLSLSKEAYDYWNLIYKQQDGATNLFQPNAIKIKGNIECVTDPNEEVLGFFGVSSVREQAVFIPESLVPYELPEIPIVPYSCPSYYLFSTTEEPMFW